MMENKVYDIEYRVVTNFIYDSFKSNTKESYIIHAEGVMSNGANAFQDEVFIKMLKQYCNEIKCNLDFKVIKNTKNVKITVELLKDSKYYFEKR